MEHEKISAAPESADTATETPAADITEAPEPKRSIWKWMIPAFLVLIAAAAAVFLLVNRDPAPKPDAYIAELNYANGGLVAYDGDHVYYLAPYDTSSLLGRTDKSICVYEADARGTNPRMICKKDSVTAIRSVGGELYCLGRDGSKDVPFLAHIDKASGKMTTLRRFSKDTHISYFLVRDSDLFYCADGVLYKGTLESADPSADTLLLENCSAVHFSGRNVYYSSEEEILAYDLRSGKTRSICSVAAKQICRKDDRLFFINLDGVFSVPCKGGEPTMLVPHSADSSLCFFTLYNSNILYAYNLSVDEINGFESRIKRIAPDPLSSIMLKAILLLNGGPERIGEDGGKPSGTKTPVCGRADQLSAIFPSGMASGFYITPSRAFYSANVLFYSMVEPMEFE